MNQQIILSLEKKLPELYKFLYSLNQVWNQQRIRKISSGIGSYQFKNPDQEYCSLANNKDDRIMRYGTV